MMVGKGDGYAGHWHPEQSVAGSGEFQKGWPLKLPEGKKSILILRSHPDKRIQWICKSCGWESDCEKEYKRPNHSCEK